MMTKAEAISIISRQLDRVPEVLNHPRFSPLFKKWHRDTEVAISQVFGETTRHTKDFTAIRYTILGASLRTPEAKQDEAFRIGLARAQAILQSLIDEVNDYWKDEAVASSGISPAPRARVEHICRKFHLVARQIRSRHANRSTLDVQDEYDVQDLLHAVLRIDFEDIRPEEWTPSYAGGASRVDFLLKRESIVVEVKKTRPGLGDRQVGDQLILDIARYQSHPDCSLLLCFIYDPDGYVTNPSGLERDLNQADGNIEVTVVVAPRGA